MAKRTPPTLAEARASVERVAGWLDDDTVTPERGAIAAAVRASARYLAALHPGGALELRVPPYVAVQCVEGLNHRRGTPPNVVELDPRTWLALATGRRAWEDVVAAGVSASGSRADLTALVPIRGLVDE
ncbi:MAG: sterol carrier family protein [Cumulibacter sp.]